MPGTEVVASSRSVDPPVKPVAITASRTRSLSLRLSVFSVWVKNIELNFHCLTSLRSLLIINVLQSLCLLPTSLIL